MALSFSAVQKAYKVLNQLKTIIPELDIKSWPEDMAKWSIYLQKYPKENTVYGYDKKYDDGWESLVFFVRNPSDELKKKFHELQSQVPNSSISAPYNNNKDLWLFGWF